MTTLNKLSIILALFCFYFSPWTRTLVLGVPQELILYESETSNAGPFYTFNSPVSNTKRFRFIKNIKRICHRGMWACFDQKDFQYGHYLSRLDFTRYSSQPHCQNISHLYSNNPKEVTRFPCISFRPVGGRNTEQNALTLYSRKFCAGQEWTVTEGMKQIASFPQSFPVASMAWTGSSNWTIFEQPNFGGLAYCINPETHGQNPNQNPYQNPDQKQDEDIQDDYVQREKLIRRGPGFMLRGPSEVDLDSVGSVMMGCDPSHFTFNMNTAIPKIRRMAETVGNVLSWGTLGFF